MSIRKCLSYDDVLLVPQYSDIESRSEVDIGSELDQDSYFSMPIISSPMDTITEAKMCIAMASCGGLGIVHRYNSIDDQVQIIKEIKESLKGEAGSTIAAAIGISGDYFERACDLYEHGVRIFCLDVAHGHHILMKRALETIKSHFSAAHLMAGNIATADAFTDLAAWGADSVRCNIGGGSICSTRVQTGHGLPGFQTLMDCAMADTLRDVKIIADGGIRNSGDIVKALAAGADFVMLGSLLAGTTETPGALMNTPEGKKYKPYRGMASKEAQQEWRGRSNSIEGVATLVPFKGTVVDVLHDLVIGIKSGLSYSGSRDIITLQGKAEFVLQTTAGKAESETHIFRKK